MQVILSKISFLTYKTSVFNVQVIVTTPASSPVEYPVDVYELLEMEMVATNLQAIVVKVTDYNATVFSMDPVIFVAFKQCKRKLTLVYVHTFKQKFERFSEQSMVANTSMSANC